MNPPDTHSIHTVKGRDAIAVALEQFQTKGVDCESCSFVLDKVEQRVKYFSREEI